MEYLDVLVTHDKLELLPAAVLLHSIKRRTGSTLRPSLVQRSTTDQDDVSVLRGFAAAMGFRGRALLMPAGALAAVDLAPLLKADIGNYQVAVPMGSAVLSSLPLFATSGPTEAIAIINCERRAWEDLLEDDWFGRVLPADWAVSEPPRPGAPLCRYDTGSAVPWRNARHETGTPWMLELRLMLDRGTFGWNEMEEQVLSRAVRPSLISELRRMPHLNGFDHRAAQTFQDQDAAAGFVP